MRKQTKIFSIFGQIEKVVADAMIEESGGRLKRIEPDMIPATALYNEQDQRAHYAIVLSNEEALTFDRRVRQLRM